MASCLRLQRIAGDRRDPLAQLPPAARRLVDAGGDVVGGAQGEEVGQQVDADPAHEAAHGRIGPVGGVGEHVVAHQAPDARRSRPEVRGAGSRICSAMSAPSRSWCEEVAIGQRRRLADVVQQPGQAQHRIRRPAGRRRRAASGRARRPPAAWPAGRRAGRPARGAARPAAPAAPSARRRCDGGAAPARMRISSSRTRSPERPAASGAWRADRRLGRRIEPQVESGWPVERPAGGGARPR